MDTIELSPMMTEVIRLNIGFLRLEVTSEITADGRSANHTVPVHWKLSTSQSQDSMVMQVVTGIAVHVCYSPVPESNKPNILKLNI